MSTAECLTAASTIIADPAVREATLGSILTQLAQGCGDVKITVGEILNSLGISTDAFRDALHALADHLTSADLGGDPPPAEAGALAPAAGAAPSDLSGAASAGQALAGATGAVGTCGSG